MSSAVSDTTASPAPFSPFSTYSSTSGVTSDGAPDLGEFTTVFRALGGFRRGRTDDERYEDFDDATTPTSFALSPSDDDSEDVANGGPTVWAHDPIASYLSSSPESPPGSPSPPQLDSDSVNISVVPDNEGNPFGIDEDNVDAALQASDQPSLGLFGALDFLAAERARFTAARGDAVGQRGNSSTTSDGTWQHAITLSPRRKRRRKRNRSEQNRRPEPDEGSIAANGDAEDTAGNITASQDDADDSSSSIDPSSSPQYYKSTPPSPPPQETQRRSQRSTATDGTTRIHYSKSTPTLRLPNTMPMDARVLHLRNLAHKLRMLFPQEAASLSAVLSNDDPNSADLSDPRGPVPRSHDTIVHVFIDHSNILFGFLAYLKRHYRRMDRRNRYMSHAALALILERGRPITRRVLVTSSPLYQPVDSAEQLAYEVQVLRRVPDTGDAPDRQTGSSSGDQSRSSLSSTQLLYARSQINRKPPPRGHAHKTSVGGGATSTTESEPSSGSGPVNGRVRYREQGVDELLQLKLHQAIADADVVPRNATIVLATGDGNVGQFNEDGFLGCVRTALKKGWKVELYSWEGGLSKAWMREFGDNDKFKIHPLDRFALDMLET